MSAKKASKKKRPAARAGARKAKPSGKTVAAGFTERRQTERETLRLRTVEPVFTVSDINRSLRFYTDVLGFILDERYTGDGGVLQGVMLKAGVCRLGLSQDDWKKGRDRQRGVAVRVWCTTVQDIDALAARIKAAGGALASGPQKETWGGRSIAVDDPDGFHLTIYRADS